MHNICKTEIRVSLLQIIEDIMTLMDLMTVFDVDTGWREMEQLGLAILLGFAAQKVM